jgi:glycosyltransferase involved in cell wall biosynthesis
MDGLVIYAPNVGVGGGLVLLRELLSNAWPVSRVTAILDRRGQANLGELGAGIDVHWAEPSVAGRWRAEKLLSRLTGPRDGVLCFHNLPPLLPTRGRVFCYVHNAYLVGLLPTSRFGGWPRARIGIERLVARHFRHRVSRYIVQTPTMATALREFYGAGAAPIDVLPFVPADVASEPPSTSCPARPGPEAVNATAQWDFIYVSDGAPHKNHKCLFAAWRLLAEWGVRPSLAVTLHPERDAALRKQLRREVAEHGLRIDDLGLLPHAEMLAAYRRSGALIFPSHAESFGIPLLEAKGAGLPILAPELDYVRDVCEPATTFDAFSSRSIARAVLRFQGHLADSVTPMTGDAFIAALCGREMPGNA